MAAAGVFDEQRWYRLKGDEAAKRVVAICEGLKTEVGEPNRVRWFEARTRYEGRTVTSDTQTSYLPNDELYNLSRSAVDTAQAEVAARQRPKPMYLPASGEWRAKRRAKKVDRFVEAQLHRRQGARYSDAWELTEDVFRDAEIAIAGVVKCSVDVASECLNLERVPAYEVLVDPREAKLGHVRNWFHTYEMDLDAAEAAFAGEDLSADERAAFTEKLLSSAAHDRMGAGPLGAAWRVAQSVTIYEAWHVTPDGKGRHVFACRSGVLSESDWSWPRPPFGLLTWSKDPFGIFGTGLVEAGANQHDLVNDIERKLVARAKLLSSRRTYFEAGTVDLEQMKMNDEEVFIPCKDLSKIPREVDVPPIQTAEAGLVQTEIGRYYDMNGISQMSASQRKEPGVDAAVAMETLNDIKSVRFMPKARAYELLFVDIGEMLIYGASDLSAAVPSLTARFPGKSHVEEIRWSDIEADLERGVIRVAPVSSMSRDPAQRLQIIEQLVNMGFLARDKYLELLGLPDLDSALQMETSQSDWIDKMVDRYLDAEDDAELKEMGGYQDPDGYLTNPMGALERTAQHYFDALCNDCPNYNADLLRRFMNSLQKMIKAAAPPAPAPAPGMAPPAGVAQALPPQALMAPQQLGAAA